MAEGTGMQLLEGVVWGVRFAAEHTWRGVLALKAWGVRGLRVPPSHDPLLYLSAGALARKIRKGEVSSEAVVQAYWARVCAVQGLVRAAVAADVAGAVAEARRADALVRSGEMSEADMAERLPLLGVPFTAKEAVCAKGMSCTGGLLSRKGLVAEEDSEAVARMRGCGAILLALTNTSELCLYIESHNSLFGTTNNPYDTNKTAGGSSGGEAALLASAASVVGLGSDLAGSIRVPAFYCGVFGHKPSPGMVPISGLYPPIGDEVADFVAVGPMARYATDLALVLSALAGPDNTRLLRLRDPVDLKSVQVYYLLDDCSPATSPTSGDMKEAIRGMARLLSSEGISVRSVRLPRMRLALGVWLASLSRVRKQRISRLLSGGMATEDTHPYGPLLMLQWLLGKSDHTFPVLLAATAHDVAPFFAAPLAWLHAEGKKLREDLLHLLKPQALLIMPTMPTAAPRHGHTLATMGNFGWCAVFNIMGFPVTQCPLGLGQAGTPIGVQIVAAPMQDRLALRMAEHLEDRLGGWTPPADPDPTLADLMQRDLW